jgi:gamma-glutamylcyclotransferase (GGCT)/AIG2-like uncharacterized protein YtfP
MTDALTTNAPDAPEVPESIPVFTYGTLRTGQYNARLLNGGVVAELDATLTGFTLYANQSDTYPYLVEDDTATVPVKGTLYMLDANHPAFTKADRMELGAGYNRQVVEVTVLDADGDSHTIPAFCWTWDRPQWLGRRITSGDWVAYSEEHEPSFFRAKSRNWK